MLTKRQMDKLQGIIGALEALQHEVEDDKAWLSDAKAKLMKYENEAYQERYLRMAEQKEE